MSNLARRIEDDGYSTPRSQDRVWLPAAAPLAMPRQAIDAPASEARPSTNPANIGLRRTALFSAALVLSFLAFLTPAKIYAEDGFSGLEVLALTLFGALIFPISCWFCSAVAGFLLLQARDGTDELQFRPTVRRPQVRTALLMPLYNEDAEAAFGRLTKIERSLAELGASGAFDIFVLSDTTKASVADDEWSTFQSFRLTSHARAYYRRRLANTERKAGNIAEWVQNFGAAYAHMLILDADSVMSGETILHLVDAMERKPDIGLIQTTPAIVHGRTLYQRTQQFGVRLYGRVAAAGLAWWSGAEATYWGHNAIVRTRAFAECCGLPILPGRKPFGGHVMSHDMVEASMLRRGGWGVHLTAALGGSFEESPPSVQAFMSRDRRWCQGNMQHIQLLAAPGLHWMSRVQMVIGVMAYWASPLWFLSLLTGLVIQFQTAPKLEEIATLHGWRTIVLPRHDGFALIWMTCLTWLLLFGPKVLGSLLVLSRPDERRAFGGTDSILKGAALEMVMSMVMAPIMMVSHTRMLIQIFSGKDAGWHTQQREAGKLSWAEACSFHAWELRAGMVFAAALLARPDLALVFTPIVAPLLFAPALSILTSRSDVGDKVRKVGFLLTPEELGAPAATVRRLRPLRRPFTPITVSFNPAHEDEPGHAHMPDLTLVAAREMAEHA
ncbi:MAG TPA: glucans biosynthesis glucosyltransferase MdoH [Phenylobacterium sp.]|nr:glucans biosynthesis glucosyltransferase MdoH [Phenylobacterium sp.]